LKNTILETDRLLIRRFDLTDADFILELLNSPDWLKFIGDRNVKTIEEAEVYLVNGPIASYEANGFGLCLVVLKDGEIPIGACGLLKRDFLEDADLGFAFLPGYIGKGFGYESATAIIAYAQSQLNISKILAFTIPENVASIKLLEKTGFHYEKKFTMPGEDEELLLFCYQ